MTAPLRTTPSRTSPPSTMLTAARCLVRPALLMLASLSWTQVNTLKLICTTTGHNVVLLQVVNCGQILQDFVGEIQFALGMHRM
jgi:hypothetical protein